MSRSLTCAIHRPEANCECVALRWFNRASKARTLHLPVQWSGWRLWLQRIGRNPLAFHDEWCRECQKPWPCPTAEALEIEND